MTLTLTLLLRVSVAVAVLGVVIALIAFLCDTVRLRGRRVLRCPRCWYSMADAPSMTCPECGRTARTSRHLTRFRYRWRTTLLGLLIAATGVTGFVVVLRLTPASVSRLPSWLLVRMVDPNPPLPGPNRSGQGAMSPPMSQALADEMWHRYQLGRLSRAHRALSAQRQFATRPPISITARSTWPADLPLRVHPTGDFSGPLPRVCMIEPQFAGGEDITLDDSGWGTIGHSRNFVVPADGMVLGPMPADVDEIVCVVRLLEAGEQVYREVVTMKVAATPGTERPHTAP